MRRAVVAFVGAAALSHSAFGQQWDTNAAPTISQSMPLRVVAQHRADEARRAGVILERQILGIPGDPSSRRVLDRMKGPGPITDVEFKVARTVGVPAVAKALARALPLVGTVLAFKDIFDAVRCRESFGGGAECDDGRPEVTQLVYTATELAGGAVLSGPTPLAACAVALPVYVAAANAQFASSGESLTASTIVYTNNLCYAQMVRRNISGGYIVWSGQSSYAAVSGPVPRTVCLPVGTVEVVKGVDGLCPTLVYTPAPGTEVEDKVRTHVPPATVIARLPDLVSRDIAVEHNAPGYQIDAPPQSSRDTTTKPDGSVTTRDTSYPWETHPDGYGWRPRVEIRDWPIGAVIPPIGQPAPVAPPPTVIDGPGAVPQEIITCGLPGTPPCKMDESGTPSPVAPLALDPAGDPVSDLKDIIATPPVAAVGFSWSFNLPSSCSPIPLGGFGAIYPELDVCRFQPMIHDLMSMIWVITGFLGAWGMLSRTLK